MKALGMLSFLDKKRKKLHRQRGDVLVMTAICLPLLLVMTGFAVDFGNAYTAKASLQSAADAAALAGGYQYLESGYDVTKTKNTTLESAQANYTKEYGTPSAAVTKTVVDTTGNEFPDDADTININTNAHDNEYVDVRLRQTVPTSFLRVIGYICNINSFKNMEIKAAARAHLTGSGGGYFDYTIFGAATTRSHTYPNSFKTSLAEIERQPQNNSDDSSVQFKGNPHNPYKISGNIGGNGRIGFNNNSGGEYNFQMIGASGINSDGISRVDTSSLYGTANGTGDQAGYNVTKNKDFMYANPQGNATGPTNSTYNNRINNPPIDISFSSSNNITKDLYAFYQQVKSLFNTNLKEAERRGWYVDDTTRERYQFDAGGLTYYNGNLRWGQDLNPLGVQCNSNNIYKHSDGLTQDQERFRVIIVGGDVDLNMEKTTTGEKLHGWDMNEKYQDVDGDGQTHDNYAVIISLHGNIHMHNYSKFRGIVYAPEGTIWLDSYDHLYGNIVGQRVIVDNQDYDCEAGPFLTKQNWRNVPHLNGASTKTVKLETLD